MSALVEVTVWW